LESFFENIDDAKNRPIFKIFSNCKSPNYKTYFNSHKTTVENYKKSILKIIEKENCQIRVDQSNLKKYIKIKF
jgi:hypothetical protein